MSIPSPSQKNIVYGTVTAGGNVHVGDITYVLERDFPHSILFLRIEKSAMGYETMLSVKGPDDASVPLLHENVQLPVADELFELVTDFQSFRRGGSQAMRLKGSVRLSEQALENNLPTAIYDSFFAGDIGTVCTDFLTLLQSGKIRDLLLVISTEDEPAQNLPWEMVLPYLTIRTDGDLPRNNFGLVRSREKTLNGFNRQGPTATAAPIKLLFIPALPENGTERSKMLEIEDEQRKIIDAVSRLEATGTNQPKLVMEILDCANLDEIKDALEKRSHDIVHVSGHGAYVEALKEGILCLEDDDGNEQDVSGRALGNVLKAFSSIKLLVLSACETAVGGPEGSTAEQLAAVGLPAVLAMRFSVTDVGARLFTEKLYERLAYGDALTKAIHDARLVLWTDVQQRRANAPNVATPAEWFTPVLYQNQVMGPLILPDRYDTRTLDRFYPKLNFVKGKHTRLIGGGFIGRKRLRIRLRQCFAQHKAVCLYGLGGLGKTTTAEAFAEHYRKTNGHSIEIFRNGPNIEEWVILKRVFDRWKAQTQPDTFLATQLLAQLESPDTAVEGKLQLLIDNCLADHRTILIFDNVEDVQTDANGSQQQTIVADGLRAFLRYLLDNAPPNCQILFTSRYRIADLADLVTHLPVDKMTYAEQYRYLNYSDILRKLPLAERAIIDRRIDGHPRALEFLEGLLRKDRQFDLTTFDTTIGTVETKIFENLLLNRLVCQLSEHERHVFTTASAFFSRTPVAALEAVLEPSTSDLTTVLASLQSWSLCFWDETAQTFEVHALTRTWLRMQNLLNPTAYKAISQQAGVFFQEQLTWEDQELAIFYFKQAENWQDYANVANQLAHFYSTIGLYSNAHQHFKDIIYQNISQKINAKSLKGLGMLAYNVSEYAKAITYLQDSLNISLQLGDTSEEGDSFNILGIILFAQGEFETALYNYQQSLNISRQTGDQKEEAKLLHNISLIYREQGNDQMAQSHLEECLKIRQQIGDNSGEDAILSTLAELLYKKKEYDEAIGHLCKSLDIKQRKGDKSGTNTIFNNLSLAHQTKGDHETALTLAKQSLSIQQELGDKYGESNTLNNIGMIHESKGEYEKALVYLRQSLGIRQQIGDQKGVATTAHNAGVIYWEQYQSAEKALTLLLPAYAIFDKIGSVRAKEPEGYITKIYEQIGEARFQEILQSIQNP